MRIVIAAACLPFNKGRVERTVDDLHREMRARDFNVDVVRIPFQPTWTTVLQQTLAMRLLDLSECGDRIDRLITVGTPSYALRHPNKVAWFIHHFREAYDFWGTPQGVPECDEGRRFRDRMRHCDDLYLRECKKVFACSRIGSERLEKYNGFQPEGVLYPPLRRDADLEPGDFGDYFFYPGRLASSKRQELAVEAMQYTHSDIRLVIAGKAESESRLRSLEEQVRRLGLEGRVQLLGWISEKRKAELLAGCRAALYLPHLEDSYGDVTLEALHSGRPVITMTDSGGSLELVEDGVNGLVVRPEPLALAEAMSRLWIDPEKARRLGSEAARTPRRLRIDWDHVVNSLTA